MSAAGTKLCPVCGSENPADATRCSTCTSEFFTTPAPVPLNQGKFNAKTKQRNNVYAKMRKTLRQGSPEETARLNAMRRMENSSGNGEVQVSKPIPAGMKRCPLCDTDNPISAKQCSACSLEFTSGGGKSRKNRSKSRKSRKNRRRH